MLLVAFFLLYLLVLACLFGASAKLAHSLFKRDTLIWKRAIAVGFVATLVLQAAFFKRVGPWNVPAIPIAVLVWLGCALCFYRWSRTASGTPLSVTGSMALSALTFVISLCLVLVLGVGVALLGPPAMTGGG